MKKVILKLAGAGQDKLFHSIQSLNGYEVIGFTDSKIDTIGKSVGGLKVVSVYEVVEMYASGRVDAVVIDSGVGSQLIRKMRDELVTLGVKPADVLLAKPEFYADPMEQYMCSADEYHCLPYIEYHVADNCNLNCRACIHFSPLVPGNQFADYKQVEADLRRLHDLVPYIERIHILGGEPLLNKELYRYLDLTREVYPYAAIAIVTNGLLLRNIDSSLIDSIKKNNVSIWISLYPPMFQQIQQIIEKLKVLDIAVVVSAPIKEFAYAFDEKGGHAKGIQRINCTCPNLYKGKLAICPPVAYIEYFNKEFQKDIDAEQGKIDIYDEALTFEMVQERLHTPIEICDKCLFVSREDAVTLEWSQTREKSYDDYVLRHNK